MSLTLISGSPCEPCAGWRGADVLTPDPANTPQNFTWTFEYDACPCGPPSLCYPAYRDLTATGGPNNYWIGPFIAFPPVDTTTLVPGSGAASINFFYNGTSVGGMNGSTVFVGSNRNVPLPATVIPAQWRGNKTDVGIEIGNPALPSYYVEWFTFYTVWDLPFEPIARLKFGGAQVYGFSYSGPTIPGKRQVAYYSGTVSGGAIYPWPEPGSIYFNRYPLK